MTAYTDQVAATMTQAANNLRKLAGMVIEQGGLYHYHPALDAINLADDTNRMISDLFKGRGTIINGADFDRTIPAICLKDVNLLSGPSAPAHYLAEADRIDQEVNKL